MKNYFIADMNEYESFEIIETNAKIHIGCKPCWNGTEYLGYDECPGCGLWVCEDHDMDGICPTCVAEVEEEDYIDGPMIKDAEGNDIEPLRILKKEEEE